MCIVLKLGLTGKFPSITARFTISRYSLHPSVQAVHLLSLQLAINVNLNNVFSGYAAANVFLRLQLTSHSSFTAFDTYRGSVYDNLISEATRVSCQQLGFGYIRSRSTATAGTKIKLHTTNQLKDEVTIYSQKPLDATVHVPHTHTHDRKTERTINVQRLREIDPPGKPHQKARFPVRSGTIESKG